MSQAKKVAHSSSLRITSGECRGRKIATPGGKTHPMGDRERLALFNALSASGVLDGADILDLYAGSGALGIEALSRGAAKVVFVEKDHQAASCILENVRELGYESRATILRESVKAALCSASLQSEIFDFILCDPPYDRFSPDEFINISDNLKPNGIFALSHPTETAPEFANLTLKTTKKHAGAHLSIYQKK